MSPTALPPCGFIRVRRYPATGKVSCGTLYPWGDFSQSPFVREVLDDIEREAEGMRAAIEAELR